MTIVVDSLLDALDRRLREAQRGQGQVLTLVAFQRHLREATGDDQRLAAEIASSDAAANATCGAAGCARACGED